MSHRFRIPLAVFLGLACFGPVSAQQVVFLDFDSATSGSDHVYTVSERQSVLGLMQADYQPFDFNFVLTAPTSGSFSTIVFNDGPALGLADAIDFRNLNPNDNATVEVNVAATTSAQFVTLSASVAAHELGHLVGLRHGDSFGPIGTGIDPNTVIPGSYLPAYPGPLFAPETQFHLMESDNIFIEDTFNQFFSERSAVKLEFNESGSVVAETAGPKNTLATAQPLTLGSMLVPNTITQGANAGVGLFDVDAVVATGSLSVIGELDLYSFTGFAGDLFNFEVISGVLDRLNNTIDSQLTILDSTGTVIPYYGSTAFNDDEFETFDSILIDLVLPADGTYYAQVNAFSAADTGDYELFAYRFNGAAIPEPGSFLLLLAAALAVLWRRHRLVQRAVCPVAARH